MPDAAVAAGPAGLAGHAARGAAVGAGAAAAGAGAGAEVGMALGAGASTGASTAADAAASTGARAAAGRALYPFSAVVGMDDLKLALLLNAVSPGVGGVLVRGEKGTAKSTVVRALAELLPPIGVVEGCRFACDPRSPDPVCPDGPHPADAQVRHRRARLAELPVGATEDRLVGSLDMERALTEGVTAYEPGLLAAAHRGLLYVDEVNLLHDHLVDLLLDAAALGTCYVEREGVSVTHAARFLLVGTMNPEEGELRPQLLDRFGLTVHAAASREPGQRAEVVRRRLAYEADPADFAACWAQDTQRLARRIADARELLPRVRLADSVLRQICAVCGRFGVDGLRADLVTARAAMALAAWRGRDEVAAEDVRQAARLALPHRRRRDPFDAPGLDEAALDEALRAAAEEEAETPDPQDDPGGSGGSPGGGSGGGPVGGRGGGSGSGAGDGRGVRDPRRDSVQDDQAHASPTMGDGDGPGGGAGFGDRASFGPGAGFWAGTGLDDGAGGRGKANAWDAANAWGIGGRDASGSVGRERPQAGQGSGQGVLRAYSPDQAFAQPGSDQPTAGSVTPAGAPFRPPVFTVPGTGAGAPGRRSQARLAQGRLTGARMPRGRVAAVHLPATLRAAAPHQRARGWVPGCGRVLRLGPADLREAVRHGREGNLVLFAVDASGSMAARQRMRAVKGAVLSLLLDAYQRRDKVGMVSFRGDAARLVLPPTSSVEAAARRLAELPAGGRTPLAAGLLRAAGVLAAERLRDPGRRPLLVIVTDGRATDGRAAKGDASGAGTDPLTRSVALLRGIASVVVDCETGPVRLGLAARLAAALGGTLVRLDELASSALAQTVHDARRRAA